MTPTLLDILIIICPSITLLNARGAHSQRYCQVDNFTASCSPNEVVIMDSATLGRMSAGKCASTGDFGCSVDVMPYMDLKCSGRRRCIVKVVDLVLHGYQPCKEDFTTYLEASYHCQAVERFNSNTCQSGGVVSLTKDAGFISSTTAQKNSYLNRCPWRITVSQGQRINITLLDFGGKKDESETVCPRYAIIREAEGRETSICSKTDRVRTVYLSDSNHVDIILTNNPGEEEEAHFLFHYQAVGCNSPQLPSALQVTKQGANLEAYCNITGERWTLICQNGHWVGKVGNCSKAATEDAWHVLSHKWTTPYGLMLVIGLGILLGIVIGTSLLALALCWMRRSKRQKEDCGSLDRYATSGFSPDACQSPGIIPDNKNGYFSGGEANNGDYSDVWGVQRLAPSYAHGVDKTSSSGYQSMSVESSLRPTSVCSTGGTSGRLNTHVYESPKFQRKDILPRSTS